MKKLLWLFMLLPLLAEGLALISLTAIRSREHNNGERPGANPGLAHLALNIGYVYQNQASNLSGVQDPLFGHQLLPNSRLSLVNPETGKPYGELLTNSAGFVKNNSSSQDEEPAQEGDFLLLVTGGSTVAGPGVEKNEHTFPAQLEAWFAKNFTPPAGSAYKRIRVLNGGVVGYNASQELVRFLFDYSKLKPQAWLQFNGTNEAWSFGELEGGIVTHYNRRFLGFAAPDPVLQAGIFPALQKLGFWGLAKLRPRAQPLLLSLRPEKDGLAKRFLETIEQSRVAAEGNGTRHFFILQPSGIFTAALEGKDQPSHPAELSAAQWPAKIDDAREFLSQLKPLLSKNHIDGTDLLDEAKDPYFDSVHYNQSGNAILAEKVGTLLLEKLFPAKPERR